MYLYLYLYLANSQVPVPVPRYYRLYLTPTLLPTLSKQSWDAWNYALLPSGQDAIQFNSIQYLYCIKNRWPEGQDYYDKKLN